MVSQLSENLNQPKFNMGVQESWQAQGGDYTQTDNGPMHRLGPVTNPGEYLQSLARLDNAVVALHERKEKLFEEKKDLYAQVRNYQGLLSDLRKVWYSLTPTLRSVAREYFARRGLDLNEPYRSAKLNQGKPIAVEISETPRVASSHDYMVKEESLWGNLFGSLFACTSRDFDPDPYGGMTRDTVRLSSDGTPLVDGISSRAKEILQLMDKPQRARPPTVEDRSFPASPALAASPMMSPIPEDNSTHKSCDKSEKSDTQPYKNEPTSTQTSSNGHLQPTTTETDENGNNEEPFKTVLSLEVKKQNTPGEIRTDGVHDHSGQLLASPITPSTPGVGMTPTDFYYAQGQAAVTPQTPHGRPSTSQKSLSKALNTARDSIDDFYGPPEESNTSSPRLEPGTARFRMEDSDTDNNSPEDANLEVDKMYWSETLDRVKEVELENITLQERVLELEAESNELHTKIAQQKFAKEAFSKEAYPLALNSLINDLQTGQKKVSQGAVILELQQQSQDAQDLLRRLTIAEEALCQYKEKFGDVKNNWIDLSGRLEEKLLGDEKRKGSNAKLENSDERRKETNPKREDSAEAQKNSKMEDSDRKRKGSNSKIENSDENRKGSNSKRENSDEKRKGSKTDEKRKPSNQKSGMGIPIQGWEKKFPNS